MRTSIETWKTFVKRRGDWQAREALKWATRPQKMLAALNEVKRKRDPLNLVHELVHNWPGGSPSANRLKFAEVIRMLIQQSREHRARIIGYCAPGVARLWLP